MKKKKAPGQTAALGYLFLYDNTGTVNSFNQLEEEWVDTKYIDFDSDHLF